MRKRMEEVGAAPESAFTGSLPGGRTQDELSPNISFFLMIIVILEFILLYYAKPGFLMTQDKDGKKVINWRVFGIAYSVTVVITGVLMFIIAHCIAQ